MKPSASTARPLTMLANKKIAGQTCPVCHSGIEIGQTIRTCDLCKLIFHLECWNENRGCATYGCERSPGAKEQARTPDIVVRLEDDQAGPVARGGRDGNPFDRTDRCPDCGASVQAGHKFCLACGTALQAAPVISAGGPDPVGNQGFNVPPKPGLLQAVGVMWLIDGIISILAAIGIVISLGILVLPLFSALYLLVLGILEVIFGSQLMSNPVELRRPPYFISVMEIIGILFCWPISLIIGIVSLCLLNSKEVLRYFRLKREQEAGGR